MKHEELVNMNMKDLKARLKEIGTQAQTAEGEALDALTTEAEDINGILQDIQNRANIAGLAAQAGDNAGEGTPGEKGDDVKNKKERQYSSTQKWRSDLYRTRFLSHRQSHQNTLRAT